MRLLLRFLPVFAAVAVTASCGSDTPTSPDLKQSSTASSKAAADSVRLAASVAVPLSARAAKRATAVSTVCARQRRSLLKARAQLTRNPSSPLLKSRERKVSASVADVCS